MSKVSVLYAYITHNIYNTKHYCLHRIHFPYIHFSYYLHTPLTTEETAHSSIFMRIHVYYDLDLNQLCNFSLKEGANNVISFTNWVICYFTIQKLWGLIGVLLYCTLLNLALCGKCLCDKVCKLNPEVLLWLVLNSLTISSTFGHLENYMSDCITQ